MLFDVVVAGREREGGWGWHRFGIKGSRCPIARGVFTHRQSPLHTCAGRPRCGTKGCTVVTLVAVQLSIETGLCFSLSLETFGYRFWTVSLCRPTTCLTRSGYPCLSGALLVDEILFLVVFSPMKMGTVDVERYTGPCLITTAVRPKPKPRPGVSAESMPDCDKHVSSGLHHQQQQQHHQLPMNDPRNWAGAPLLSMAATIRKTKTGGMNKSWHPPPVYLPAPMMHPATSMDGYAAHTSHLQGAPLIRVPRQQQPLSSFHKKNLSVHGPAVVSRRGPPCYLAPTTSMPPTPSPLPLPSAPEMTSAETGDASSSSGCPSSDTCSVTSDEGLASGGSESSLPRIIKPRKRRKKGQESQRTKGLTGSESSSALSELDDLLSNQGDSLAELFRHTLSTNPPSTTSSSSTADSSAETPNCLTPPLWPGQSAGEEDIWSSGCWHSMSPVWSPSGSSGPSPSSSSSSCWPDQRVIRRPDRVYQRPYVNVMTEPPPPFLAEPMMPNDSQLLHHGESGHFLQVSSQLIASPFNGHRDIEIRFFSSTAQASETPEHNSPPISSVP